MLQYIDMGKKVIRIYDCYNMFIVINCNTYMKECMNRDVYITV